MAAPILPPVTRQRASKLSEYVAHGSTVNSVYIGRKSGTIMATGGDDKKVNLWAIGKPNALASISGHQSAVECVALDANEQTVVAGSAGGTIKMWDVERSNVARTLTGHRANCLSVQWHPYGEFFASGSVDTNLKIWDIRRKSCIQTYKGHTRGIRQILFSPDGRWVISGGDDGLIKVWDLTMGKLLHEFTFHSGAITALAIHPSEFLMASASADRTVRLWDLETFEPVCCTPADSSPVRRVCFSDDGRALLAGGEDVLKVWGWEPVRCFEVAEVRWSKLADMVVMPDQRLLSGSTREALVATWSVDLSSFRVLNGAEAPPGGGGGVPSNVASAPPAAFAGVRQATPPEPPRTDPRAAAAEARAAELEVERQRKERDRIARERGEAAERRLREGERREREAADEAARAKEVARAAVAAQQEAAREEAARQRDEALRQEAAAARQREEAVAAARRLQQQQQQQQQQRPAAAATPASVDPNSTVGVLNQIAGCRAAIAAAKQQQSRPSGPEAVRQAASEASPPKAPLPGRGAAAAAAADLTPGGKHKNMATSMGDSLTAADDDGTAFVASQLPPARYAAAAQPQQPQQRAAPTQEPPPPSHPNGAGAVPADRDVPLGLDPAAFLPKPKKAPVGTGAAGAGAGPRAGPGARQGPGVGAGGRQLSAEEQTRLVAELLEKSSMQRSCMQQRLGSLRVLQRYWQAGDTKRMVAQLAEMGDPSLVVDLLKTGCLLHTSLDLEGALLLLPLLTQLLLARFDDHQVAAVDALQQLLLSFGGLIVSSRAAKGHPGVGVDLLAEDRRQRCEKCHEHFAELRPHAARLAAGTGKAKQGAAELVSALREQLGIDE